MGINTNVAINIEEESTKIIIKALNKKIAAFDKAALTYKCNRKRSHSGQLPLDVEKTEESISNIRETVTKYLELNTDLEERSKNMNFIQKSQFFKKCEDDQKKITNTLLYQMNQLNKTIEELTKLIMKRNSTVQAVQNKKQNNKEVLFESKNSSRTWRSCIEDIEEDEPSHHGLNLSTEQAMDIKKAFQSSTHGTLTMEEISTICNIPKLRVDALFKLVTGNLPVISMKNSGTQ